MEADVFSTTRFSGETEIDRQMKQAEENFVINVLWQLLDRQPTIDDFDKCRRVYYGHSPEYVLYYDNKKLGEIKLILETNKLMMEFIPE
jgi:hypothetical protein